MRAIAIIIEVVILALIAYSVLEGVRLMAHDLGIGPKYRKEIAAVFTAVGALVVLFFVAHLTSFYPGS